MELRFKYNFKSVSNKILQNLTKSHFRSAWRDCIGYTIKWCMFYLDCLPLSLEYKFRRFKFLSNLKTNENGLILKVFGIAGKNEIFRFCTELKIDVTRIDFTEVKQILWNNFHKTLKWNYFFSVQYAFSV